MTNKEEFLQICREVIHRDGIEDLLAWLEKSDFFIAPASTRFHNSFPGGLAAHSLSVYKAFNKLLPGYCDALTNYTEETVAIVSLFHDICKTNYYKQGKRNVKDEHGHWVEKTVYEIDEKFPCGEHADKSIIILQQYIKLTPDEILAIRAHMGGWDVSVKGGAHMIGSIFEKCPLAVLLHVADMTSTYLCESRAE